VLTVRAHVLLVAAVAYAQGSWAASNLGDKWWTEMFLPEHDLASARAHCKEDEVAKL
jgi:hypothetical protein